MKTPGGSPAGSSPQRVAREEKQSRGKAPTSPPPPSPLQQPSGGGLRRGNPPCAPGRPERRDGTGAPAAPRPGSPAELPAGAEVVPVLEGLGADGRADLRQEAASPPAPAGSGLRWQRPVTAGAAEWRLLLGAHGAGLLPQTGGRLPSPSPLGLPLRRAGLPSGCGVSSRCRCSSREEGGGQHAPRRGEGQGGAQPRGPAL